MKPIIELNAITVRYSEEERAALNNVSFFHQQRGMGGVDRP